MNRLFDQGPNILAQWGIQVVLATNLVDLKETKGELGLLLKVERKV